MGRKRKHASSGEPKKSTGFMDEILKNFSTPSPKSKEIKIRSSTKSAKTMSKIRISKYNMASSPNGQFGLAIPDRNESEQTGGNGYMTHAIVNRYEQSGGEYGSVTNDVNDSIARIYALKNELLQKTKCRVTPNSLTEADVKNLRKELDKCRRTLFNPDSEHVIDLSDESDAEDKRSELLPERVTTPIETRESMSLDSYQAGSESFVVTTDVPGTVFSTISDDVFQNCKVATPADIQGTISSISGQDSMENHQVESDRSANRMFIVIDDESSSEEHEVDMEDKDNKPSERITQDNKPPERKTQDNEKAIIVSATCLDVVSPNDNTEDLGNVTECEELELVEESDHDFQWNTDSDDESKEEEADELSSMWTAMSLIYETNKIKACEEGITEASESAAELCNHSYVRRDDVGYYCLLCGFIETETENIFDFERPKKAPKRYKRGARELMLHFGKSEEVLTVAQRELKPEGPEKNVVLHPKYKDLLKTHQIEGFEFLRTNLVAKEHGCILAHAPGTGKTFLVISFIRSFLTEYPDEKPVIVAPKSILTSWKKELEKWKLEIPVLTVQGLHNAEETTRGNQLQILKEWEEKSSILLISYHLFSTIVCEESENGLTKSCRQLLLECPGLLVLDEGHFPRNKDTNVLQALSQIRTKRRILLSGTLFQNNFKEFFNLLRLVRPNILDLREFQDIFRSLVEKVYSTERCRKFHSKTDDDMEQFFSDIVEQLLKTGGQIKRDTLCMLRKLTSLFVHYYKGEEVLQDLPGLFDYTVKLSLNPMQETVLNKYKYLTNRMKLEKQTALVCTHPLLEKVEETQSSSVYLVNKMDSIDPNDGVKTKFVIDVLNFCVAAKEKLIVFSQYLPSLDILEKILVHKKKFKQGSEVLRLDGKASLEQRETLIDQFNVDPNAKVLFASIRALGEGISLTSATRVIILDIPWNPSITRQAISRAYRMGQKGKVFAYRLVAVNTMEEEISEKSLTKELNAKMLFDLDDKEVSDSILCKVDVDDCEDLFFQFGSPLRQNLQGLYRHTVL